VFVSLFFSVCLGLFFCVSVCVLRACACVRPYCTSALAQSAVIVWGGYDIYIHIVKNIF